MKSKRNLIFIMSVMLLSGCGGQGGNSSDTSDFDGNSSESQSQAESENDDSLLEETTHYYTDDTPIYSFETRYERIKDSYPDKTVLVWASNQDVRYEDEVNEYLSEHDCEYVICFKNLTYDIFDENMLDENGNFTTSYTKLLEESLADGEQTDIIDTGFKYQGADAFYNPYQYCVKNGWFEPIDGYLEDTESGRNMFELMSENYWKSLEIDGKIYGIDGSLSCLKEDAGYVLNSQLIDENGISLDTFSGDYTQSFENAIGLCEENGWNFSVGMLGYLQLFTDYDFITDCIYIDENHKAENIYESEFATQLFDTLADGYGRGAVLNSMTQSNSDSQTYLGNISSSLCAGYVNNNFKTSEYYGLSFWETAVEAYDVYPEYSDKIYSSSKAVGVSSSSENKELAFEAICEIMGDAELNNLICFGTDYQTVDGCISPNGYFNTAGMENRLLRMPFYGVNDSKSNEKLGQALSEFELSENSGFAFDCENVSEQIIAVDEILKNIDTEFPSEKYKTGKEYIDSLNERLYGAGLQYILDEVDKQLAEYYES